MGRRGNRRWRMVVKQQDTSNIYIKGKDENHKHREEEKTVKIGDGVTLKIEK